jgi:ATP-dependent RNA helicase DDX23/PRP28
MKATDTTSGSNENASSWLTDKERELIKYSYLGKSAVETEETHLEKKKKLRGKKKKKNTFRFEWDDADDTLDDADPLYSGVAATSKNITHPSSKHPTAAASQFNKKRPRTTPVPGSGGNNNYYNRKDSVMTKPLESMTSRDWRIFRENFDIVVKGGKAPPPMRNFREAPSPELPTLHPALLDAIENVMKYTDPSPIQRQAIPIGLQRRDLIGIAETGSGKTCAFGVPLCHYILSLPEYVINRVAEQGPLALVVAPTRELALQINGEFTKLLSRQHQVHTCAIVGGQVLQQQAQQLRKGVHIVVGTPGRLNECIEMAYLVLNQCCYIVLDEADRMIDM